MNLPYQVAQIYHKCSYLMITLTTTRFNNNQNVQSGLKFSNQKSIYYLFSLFYSSAIRGIILREQLFIGLGAFLTQISVNPFHPHVAALHYLGIKPVFLCRPMIESRLYHDVNSRMSIGHERSYDG